MARKGIDTFTKEEFEAALPKLQPVGDAPAVPLWEYAGFIQGEHCYIVRPFPSRPFGIMVRSSVKGDGINAECGEDSIRGIIVKLVGKEWVIHGGKSCRWVTRQTGWDVRMLDMLRKLSNQINWCQPCPKCGEVLVPFTSRKKTSPVKGQGFVRCESAKCYNSETNKSATFFLTDDDEKDPIKPPEGFGKSNQKPAPPVCPNCQKPALIPDQYATAGGSPLFCYPRKGGCGWKGDRSEAEIGFTSNTPEPVRPTKPPLTLSALVGLVETMIEALHSAKDANAAVRSAPECAAVHDFIQRFNAP